MQNIVRVNYVRAGAYRGAASFYLSDEKRMVELPMAHCQKTVLRSERLEENDRIADGIGSRWLVKATAPLISLNREQHARN